jgi:GNAT superfamily N-acetyltransferase
MEAIIYRQFCAADADDVQALAREAWHKAYPHLFSAEFIDETIDTHYAPDWLRSVVPDLERNRAFFPLAVAGTQVIGFCHVRMTERGAELFRLYLRPAYIGQGIGRRLLEISETYLLDQEVKRYFCFVNKGNFQGQQFYLRQGFQHVTQNDLSDSYYMQKLLE